MTNKVLKERYAIQKQLGRNAGRRTLLAKDLQTQELVAIKILTFNADLQWQDLKLFEREAEALQSLSHPAIPRYLDYFEFQTRKTKGFALVQSYIPAKSLAEWVEERRIFNEEKIQQLATSLLEILIYLHQQSPPVIHRDIKPSNILLGDSIEEVYLVDFGSVQTLAATEGSTITVVGTYGYMPPEQFGGRAVPASDLYSLGATLVYLVTRTHPAELPQEDLRIKFRPKIKLSTAFINWLKLLIEPDLNKRFKSAQEVLENLEKLSYLDNFSIPTKTKKLGKSKFKVNKHQDSLKITIYPLNVWTWTRYCGVFVLGIILFRLLPFLLIGGIGLIGGAFSMRT
ncbi:MAG: serine/threonine-protein kinase, partial [Spirulinaceae cyanobacterium]